MSDSVSSITPVLLFTDIVNSTDLQRLLGNTRYRTIWERHNRIFLDACSTAQNATVLKNTGDSFLVRFVAPSDAVACAIRFQRAMKGANWSEFLSEPFSARTGLHLGEVEEVADPASGRTDVLGYTASIAARVMGLATGGQVLMTRGVFDSARLNLPGLAVVYGFTEEERQALRYESWGRYLFKGAVEPDEICEIGLDGLSPLIPPPDSDKAKSIPIDYELRGWRPSEDDQIPHRDGWKLERMLGEGGFGEAWLAQHLPTAEFRVFKFCVVAERLQTFRREQALFRHLRQQASTWSGFVRLFETHLDTAPYFLEIEYSSLGSLDQWAVEQGGIALVSIEERMRIFVSVARAADDAHTVGIIHCDLKPANILMFLDGPTGVEPRLADFGIGHLAERSRSAGAENVLQTLQDDPASRTGTRLYAAPELHANPHLRPTVQRDIYALGVILFQLVVEDFRRPLGSGWERDISDELLREDIANAVDVHPECRFASAAEFAERIDNLEERRRVREAERKSQREAAEAETRALVRRRRLILATVVCAALLVASGVASAWWDYTRVKVSYFATYQDRWGIPQGLIPMSEEARRHRFYYRFESSRRRLRKVEVLSSNGVMHYTQIRSDVPATQLIVVYRENGSLHERRYLDRYGKLLITEEVSADGRFLTLRDKNGLPRPSASQLTSEANFTRGYTDPDEFRNLTQIARQELEYNTVGQLIRLRYQDVLGSPAAERDGTFGAEYRYDERGDPIETISLGPDGRPGVDHRGIRTVKMKCDAYHRLMEKTYLGLDGKPVIGDEGFARVTNFYDQRGLCIAQQMFGPSGTPVVVPANFSSVKFDFDNDGFLIRTAYFGPDGAPTTHRNGFFAVLSKHDERGWHSETRYFDGQEQPCLNRDGVTTIRFVYDAAGNDLNEKYYGLQGEPATMNGVHEVIMKYDDHGNRTSREFRDTKGARVVGKDGFAIEEDDFDERGRVLEVRFRDANGNLTYGKSSGRIGAIFRQRYSKDGVQLSSSVFDPLGKPILDQYGIHAMDVTFSPFGTVENTALFGTNHEPVIATWGFHRSQCGRDAHGRAIWWAWFGTDGRPVIQRESMVHRRERSYDSLGFLVAEKYFDTEGRPSLAKEGYAEIRLQNDEQGRIVASDYFGIDGKSTVAEFGIAGVRNRYNTRGNLFEMATIGVNGAISESSLGFSIMRKEFDEANREVSRAAYDENGSAALDSLGYHRMNSRYDARGNLVERSYFGPEGNPVLVKIPLADLFEVPVEDKRSFGRVQAYFSLLRLSYDDLGRAVSLSTFGTDLQPISGLANAHEMRIDYNTAGIVVGFRCLDVKGQPTLATLGFASCESRTDERGWPLETRYRGPDGRGIWRFDPALGTSIAGALQEHDSHGRVTRAWCLDPDFQRTTTNSGIAAVAHRYDPFGNDLEQTYLDLAGQPVNAMDGYSTILREYDQYGHVTKQSTRDATGAPVAMAAGIYSQVLENNLAGQTIRQLNLGANGQPIDPDVGPAIIEALYNSRALQTEESVYDAQHRPTLTSQGYSRIQMEYTPAGQMLSRRFLGPDGNLIEVPSFGYAEERMKYDRLRRPVEISYFDAKGRLTSGKFGVAQILQTYSQDGSEVRCLDEHGVSVNGFDGWAQMVISSSTPGALDRAQAFDADGKRLVAVLMVETIQPSGIAKKIGLEPNDIILRVGDWNCLKDNDLSFDRRMFQFTSQRLIERGPVPAIVTRNGERLSFTFPAGLLDVVLKDHYLPEVAVRKILGAEATAPIRKPLPSGL